MFKPEELVPRDIWTFVLSKLSTKDELSCRCVCNFFKKEVDSIINKNQDRLWLRHRDNDYAHYFCYDKDHRISSRDTLYFDGMICIKNLKFVSNLMPSLKILQLDPLDQVFQEYYDADQNNYDVDDLHDYRDEKSKAVPISKIFPQVACFILPGRPETDNFVGDLSQVKHLTLFDYQHERFTFPNLDSLEVRKCLSNYGKHLPMPSKRFVVPETTIKWRSLPKTLEVIETRVIFDEYISVGKPLFQNLKILKGLDARRYDEGENLEALMNFLKDHKGSLTELSFSAQEKVANIKILLPLLMNLHKLSVKIKTDKQAIELKEIKVLAHNLKYFELCFAFCSRTGGNFGTILENLPTGLDNLSIKGIRNYEEIKPFMEKIMEKILNGETKTVTISVLDKKYEYCINEMIEEIIRMKPSSVRVSKTNKRVIEKSISTRSNFRKCIRDIVISL